VSEPYRRKLIEVALPLEAINRESAREKSIRHGHPSTLHLWWARRPLAACRAVLFASLVDDPSSRPEEFPTEEAQDAERQRLFRITEELVKWENSNDVTLIKAVRAEILRSTDGDPPPVLDPFCGGGSIPLEAQRLGLEAYASDLNPVAVLITKALIEIPPKFAGRPPLNPESQAKLAHGAAWTGAQGLAEDVRHYGSWMREQAFERIGHLYPKAKLPDGGEATVIAWLWARSVKCPNPACGIRMPLVRSFVLSTKRGNETHVRPRIHDDQVSFSVVAGKDAPASPKIGRGAHFQCIGCGQAADDDHIKREGAQGRMTARLLAVVAEGKRKRIYVGADPYHEQVAASAEPEWLPDGNLADDPRNLWCIPYGLRRFADLFTPRQLAALGILSGLVSEARERVVEDGGEEAYADALATYLALAVDRLAMTGNSLVRWNSVGEKAQHSFGRQALPMLWDFAEPNFFASATGSVDAAVELVADPLERLGGVAGHVSQLDATASINAVASPIISTDPPYYDNIGYAGLSDFFYVWLRRSLRDIYPDVFSTLLTPKDQELVADPYRFDGDRNRADAFFERGLRDAFNRMLIAHDPDFPLTLYYAFKQAESDGGPDAGVASTGWETMLKGLLETGFSICGTWPIRTEMRTRQIAMGTNALASSIVLACRPRAADAPVTTRRDFVSALRAELPTALRTLEHANIAPVDLAQAAIGPGMAIFSRYSKVVEADGAAMTVRTALGLINHSLDEILAEQEGDFDPYTRFAVSWFKEYGFGEGEYGRAETLATARAVSVDGVVRAGILHSRGSKVRLLKQDELDPSWDPSSDSRPTVWEAAHHLVHRLDVGGESSAAELLRRLGGYGETARELAHVLYSVCDRKGWAQEALDYNALGTAWRDIAQLASEQAGASEQQSLGV
jgi:putative DNA methylase